MTINPDPALPGDAIEAAVAAAARTVRFTTLEPGPVMTGEAAVARALPVDDPVFAALKVSGAIEGTITFAVGDELQQRLEYTAGVEGPTETLAPLAEALLLVLGTVGGAVEATPLEDAEADAWPGESPPDAPPVSCATLISDDDERVMAVAFAVARAAPADPEPEPAATMVSAPGTSALSTSTPGGAGVAEPAPGRGRSERLGAVEVELAGVLGETVVALEDLLAWLPGVIVPLHRTVGLPVDLRIAEATVAHAEVVVVDERYALRVLDVVRAAQARATRLP